MIALVVGLVVGYVLAIPPGPIGLAAVRTGLKHGAAASRWLAFGAGLFDLAYCFFAMSASVGIAHVLQLDSATSPVFTYAAVAVAAAIAVLGVYQFRNPISLNVADGDGTSVKTGKPFITGAAYALANLANPTFIPSLLVMSAYILASGVVERNMADRVLFSLGFGVGNYAWLVTLVHIFLRYKHRMPERAFSLAQRIMAAAVVIFGLLTGIRLVML
jgi:threonine/homoserine/homoserine lactone efflux protein